MIGDSRVVFSTHFFVLLSGLVLSRNIADKQQSNNKSGRNIQCHSHVESFSNSGKFKYREVQFVVVYQFKIQQPIFDPCVDYRKIWFWKKHFQNTLFRR